MRALAITSLVIASIALAGCKGDSKSTTLSDEEFKFAATAAANAVLITRDDLPAGFEVEVEDEDDEDEELPDPVVDLTGDCEEFERYVDVESERIWTNSAAEADGPEYEGPDSISVSSDAAAFREPAEAEEEIDLFYRFIETCDEQMERIFKDYFATIGPQEEDGIVVEDFSADFSTFDVPNRGDWSGGNRMRMKFSSGGLDFELFFDTIQVRVGRMVGSVDMTHGGEPDQELYDELADLLLQRLEEQDAKLP